MKKFALLLILSIQGSPAVAADFLGTVAIVEPVTQRTSIFFVIDQKDAMFRAGCASRGSGILDIAVQPKRYSDEPVSSVFNPSQHRFAGEDKVHGNQWRAVAGSQRNELSFDDAVLGGTARKAKFLDHMSRSSAFYLRYWTGRNSNSISFDLGDAASSELRKMIHACQPKGVLASLSKLGSSLAAPLHGSEGQILTIGDDLP